MAHVDGHRPTEEFFGRLAERGESDLLRRLSGSLRFDVADDDRLHHWLVAIDDGAVTVSRRRGKADTVVQVDRELLDDLVTGTRNATAAMLRGHLVADGDLALMWRFQRLFPGPTTGYGPKARRPQKARAGASS